MENILDWIQVRTAVIGGKVNFSHKHRAINYLISAFMEIFARF